MHGYEMIREIEDQSGEIFRLNLGTLVSDASRPGIREPKNRLCTRH